MSTVIENQVVDAGSTVEKLTAMVDSDDRHDIAYADILPLQIEAANERLQSRRDKLKLLGHRADTAGIDRIEKAADLVPLLFDHTAYKTYPESWFTQGKWDMMGKWLDTISTHRVEGVDNQGVEDVDQWIERLAATGHFISCSSGTTGKCSMLNASTTDRDFIKRNMVAAFAWTTGVLPNKDYVFIKASPLPHNFRGIDCGGAVEDAYSTKVLTFPGEPITVGQVTRMVALRRSIAEGSAHPSDIQAFEETSAKRAKALEDGVATSVQRLIDNRDAKLVVCGMTGGLYQAAEAVRAAGHGGKAFHPDNILQTGGGLKGTVAPPNYREIMRDTFNIRDNREFQFYSMQEINTILPRCSADRYHAPPWLMVLLLNEAGDALIEPNGEEQEGRAGFFDVSMDQRWGGVISGDKIKVNYGTCACGHEGPSISADIVRYSDLPGGDKISCSGTVEAYVRGAI